MTEDIFKVHAPYDLFMLSGGGITETKAGLEIPEDAPAADHVDVGVSVHKFDLPREAFDRTKVPAIQAGDKAGAEKLWKAELPKAVAPYYFMVDLAGLKEEEKDYPAAIDWLKQAAETAQGPATRIQWAILYSNGVMVSPKIAREKPEAVRGLVRAINRALKESVASPALTAARQRRSPMTMT